MGEEAEAKCPKYELVIETAAMPNPGDIIGKLACGVLTNKGAEEKWSSALCNDDVAPDLARQCIRIVRAFWEKAEDGCPKDDSVIETAAFPNPGDIIGKLACGVLTNKGAEEKWSSALCNVAPDLARQCIRIVRAFWEK